MISLSACQYKTKCTHVQPNMLLKLYAPGATDLRPHDQCQLKFFICEWLQWTMKKNVKTLSRRSTCCKKSKKTLNGADRHTDQNDGL